MNNSKSKSAFEKAKKFIAGGVNSPVRAFANVGTTPRFIERAKGSKIYDIDGNEFIDYVGSWGPMFLGHAYDKVTKAIQETAEKSCSFGAPCEKETLLAEKICNLVKPVELVRMVNSGTEATMSAIRLARGYTNREIIVKFEGCYHGHSDSLLIKAGSGALTFGTPSSAGVPSDFAKYTITLPYNNINALEKCFTEYGDRIAGVIVEAVAGNMGVVPPAKNFLETIRNLTTRYGALFIVDEVMTGFRLSLSGACGRFNLSPDIITFGKIIGGGLPVGAYGGKREIMSCVSPLGKVYQAGTLSGNPLAMSAGLVMLNELTERPEIYDHVENISAKLEDGIRHCAEKYNVTVQINRVGSMLSVFFTDKPVYDFSSATLSDTDKFSVWFNSMLSQGIYLAPSQYEAVFVSDAHTDEDIEKTIACAEKAMYEVSRL